MSLILDAIAAERWLIHDREAALNEIIGIASRQLSDKDAAAAERALREQQLAIMAGPSARRMEGARYAMTTDAGVAVIPVFGAIFPRANMMTEMSGAVSAASLLNDYRLSLESGDVGATMLMMDTPGGAVTGISALFDAIYAGSKKKPCMAYVTGAAASAGYWLAAATGNIVMDRTAMVGSIGVVVSTSKQVQADQNGRMSVEIVSSNAPDKRVDPTTEDGADKIRAIIDPIETQFIADIARGRGISVAKVKSDFAKGNMKTGQDAVDLGMADSVKSYDAAFNDLASMVRNKRRADALRK